MFRVLIAQPDDEEFDIGVACATAPPCRTWLFRQSPPLHSPPINGGGSRDPSLWGASEVPPSLRSLYTTRRGRRGTRTKARAARAQPAAIARCPPGRRIVLGIMSRLGLRLALLGPGAELFRVRHADPTHWTRPRLPRSSRRRSARRMPQSGGVSSARRTRR